MKRWTGSRVLAVFLILGVSAAFGAEVYHYLDSHRSTLTLQVPRLTDPTKSRQAGPIDNLPGTLYVAANGAIYRLHAGTFSTVLPAPGGGSSWTQPAISADGQSLIVVQRGFETSDLYLVNANTGQVEEQLTHDLSRSYEFNDWAFYPKWTANDRDVFFSWDRPKDLAATYNVTLKIWEMRVSDPAIADQWTYPAGYSGGDVEPQPLASGGIVFTRYFYDQQTIYSQIWLADQMSFGAYDVGTPLTPEQDDCSQPSVSPDGTELAMICTGGGQTANIEVASLQGNQLGNPITVVSGMQASQPTWAPDGTGLVFFAPYGPSGAFQLWWEPVPKTLLQPTPVPPSPSPSKRPAPARPTLLTTNLNFDASSPIAWHS
jgi:hypothetical protein